MKSMYTYDYPTPAWYSHLHQSWTMPCGVITERFVYSFQQLTFLTPIDEIILQLI